jgi:DNA-binding CsgD family transcriptional regulator
MECKQLWEILTRKQLAMAALVSRGCSTAEVGAIIGNSYEKTKQITFEIYNRTSLNRVELALRFLHEEQNGDIETLASVPVSSLPEPQSLVANSVTLDKYSALTPLWCSNRLTTYTR